MDVTIFGILNFIALFLLFYGYYSRNDTPRIMAVTVIFMLGMAIEPTIPSLIGDVEYASGSSITQTGSTYTMTTQYTTFSSHMLGFLYMAFGGLLLAIILGERRAYNDE